MTDPRRQNADLVESLGSALRDGEHGLGTVPMLLHRVLEAESWREFVTQRGEEVKHDSWAEFVATPPLKGLGSTIDMVRRIAADDPVVLDLLDRAVQGRQGERTDLVDNINEVRPDGTSADQALRRLRKDRPDLHKRVLAGELSPHRAMVQAGFRRHTVSVPVDQPDSVARSLRKHMSPEAIAQLIEHLKDNQ